MPLSSGFLPSSPVSVASPSLSKRLSLSRRGSLPDSLTRYASSSPSSAATSPTLIAPTPHPRTTPLVFDTSLRQSMQILDLPPRLGAIGPQKTIWLDTACNKTGTAVNTTPPAAASNAVLSISAPTSLSARTRLPLRLDTALQPLCTPPPPPPPSSSSSSSTTTTTTTTIPKTGSESGQKTVLLKQSRLEITREGVLELIPATTRVAIPHATTPTSHPRTRTHMCITYYTYTIRLRSYSTRVCV